MAKEKQQEQKKQKESWWKRWGKRAAVFGGITLGVLLKSKDAKAQQPVVKDAKQTNVENVSNQQANNATTIQLSNKLSKDELLLQEVINMLADDPQFVANMLEEKGLNTLNNFNFEGFNWTAEDLQDLKNDGPMSKKLKDNIGVVDRENKTGINCLAAIKAGLRLVGFDCAARSPYQMPYYLNKSDKFVEIKINVDPKTSWSQDYKPLYNIDDCAFVFQNQNKKKYPDVIHGHSSITWTENGKRVQKSGKKGPKGFPTSNRRNASTYYNGYRVYCFSDGHVTGSLLVKLVEEDRCTVRIDSMIKVYVFDNPQIAKMHGITDLEALKKPKLQKLKAEIIKKHDSNGTDVSAPDNTAKFMAGNDVFYDGNSLFVVKKSQTNGHNKAPKKEDMMHGKGLAAYIRQVRSNNQDKA